LGFYANQLYIRGEEDNKSGVIKEERSKTTKEQSKKGELLFKKKWNY